MLTGDKIKLLIGSCTVRQLQGLTIKHRINEHGHLSFHGLISEADKDKLVKEVEKRTPDRLCL